MTTLHENHYGVLLSFSMRYVRTHDQAEDIVQETFLRAWRTLEKIEADQTRVRSYLFTIARNVVTDQWRATQRRPLLVSDDEVLAAVPTADDMDAVLQGQLVAAALDRLSREHRTVIQALYYDGLSTSEAAALLTVPEGTVKSRAYYALRNLRAAFEEMGVLR